MRGYFGIGIDNSKFKINLGTLWRSAMSFGASFTFTTGERYEMDASNTTKTWRHIPHFYYSDISKLVIPKDCSVVGIENIDSATPLERFTHPTRCIYLLGAEDGGLSDEAMNICNTVVIIPTLYCINVSVAGSIVMYDRILKDNIKE